MKLSGINAKPELTAPACMHPEFWTQNHSRKDGKPGLLCSEAVQVPQDLRYCCTQLLWCRTCNEDGAYHVGLKCAFAPGLLYVPLLKQVTEEFRAELYEIMDYLRFYPKGNNE